MIPAFWKNFDTVKNVKGLPWSPAPTSSHSWEAAGPCSLFPSAPHTRGLQGGLRSPWAGPAEASAGQPCGGLGTGAPGAVDLDSLPCVGTALLGAPWADARGEPITLPPKTPIYCVTARGQCGAVRPGVRQGEPAKGGATVRGSELKKPGQKTNSGATRQTDAETEAMRVL